MLFGMEKPNMDQPISTLNDLPDELRNTMFNYLPTSELTGGINRVSSEWNASVADFISLENREQPLVITAPFTMNDNDALPKLKTLIEWIKSENVKPPLHINVRTGEGLRILAINTEADFVQLEELFDALMNSLVAARNQLQTTNQRLQRDIGLTPVYKGAAAVFGIGAIAILIKYYVYCKRHEFNYECLQEQALDVLEENEKLQEELKIIKEKIREYFEKKQRKKGKK